MAVRWAEVIRGTSSPDVVLVISSMALATGEAPVVLMATWPLTGTVSMIKKRAVESNIDFLIYKYF